VIVKKNIVKNHTLNQTLNEVERLSKTYFKDMIPFRNKTIYEMFKFISTDIRFKKDPPNTELVLRPRLTLKRGCGDCDDKTVLFLSWLKLKKIPAGYSIVSDSIKKPYHHIFPFIRNKSGGNIDVDATYSYYKIGNYQRGKWKKRLDFFL
jgi:transglutaminase-like putative cysteine protease